MPEKELPRTVSRPVFNTYALTVCALLTALSVVLARVLTLIPAETTRISLEAVPIVLSGLLFGPIPGAVVGFAADLIGCLFSPFGYNPIFCVPPILYGLLAGAVRRYVTDRPALLRTALAFFPAAIVGSVLWQSMALALVYGGDAKQAFFLAKLVSRSIQFALTGTVDTLIVWLLLRRGAKDTEIAACVEKVIYAKPREHCFTEAAQERERADCRKETALMSRIGG